MTVALVAATAATLFSGNQKRSRRFLKKHGDINTMLCKANFNRRLHEVPEALWQTLLHLLAQEQQISPAQKYAVDSLPVEVMLAPGAETDITAFRRLLLLVPQEAHRFPEAHASWISTKRLCWQREVCIGCPRVARTASSLFRHSKQPLPAWMNYTANTSASVLSRSSARSRLRLAGAFMR